jgi:ABC-type polysaccharide/polyol phosphate transport system ATPase subunit
LLRERPNEAFVALKGVSFNVAKGSTVGVIGRNGPGRARRSAVAGIAKPSAGTVKVTGRVSALINRFFIGDFRQENVFINASCWDSKREVEERFDDIGFRKLREFIVFQ